MFGLSPRGLVWLLAIAASIAAWYAGVMGVRAWNESMRAEGRAEIVAKWAAEVAASQAAEDAKEAARRAAQEKADALHAQALARAADDAARLRDAGQRLQQRVDQLVAAARRQASAGGAAAGPRPGVEGADPLDLLAGMFSRADREAGELGEYADQLRAAGELCERRYDALTATSN